MAKNFGIETPARYQSFMIFEPASSRVSSGDILLQGDDIQVLYDDLMAKLLDKKQTIKEQILQNRLVKIGQMLELLQTKENLILTKFFDRIWRRYSYISNLGESFLDFETFIDYFPKYDKDEDQVIALRFDVDEDEDFESDSDDNDSEDTENKDEEKADDKEKGQDKDKDKDSKKK